MSYKGGDWEESAGAIRPLVNAGSETMIFREEERYIIECADRKPKRFLGC